MTNQTPLWDQQEATDTALKANIERQAAIHRAKATRGHKEAVRALDATTEALRAELRNG